MSKLIEIINDQPMTTSIVVAEQFDREHKNVLASIKNLIDNKTIGGLDFKLTYYTDKSNRQSKMYELSERGFLIAMPFIGGSKAEQGQAKLVDAFLDSHKQPIVETPPTLPELQIAEAAARMMRLSDTSKIRMLTTIAEDRGVSSRFLPQYTDEKLTKAIGDLLRDHDVELSAIATNKILLKVGILEELERRSSKGKPKKFKSITEAGLKYGKNETSPQSPNETQPRYYVETFPELLDLIAREFSITH